MKTQSQHVGSSCVTRGAAAAAPHGHHHQPPAAAGSTSSPQLSEQRLKHGSARRIPSSTSSSPQQQQHLFAAGSPEPWPHEPLLALLPRASSCSRIPSPHTHHHHHHHHLSNSFSTSPHRSRRNSEPSSLTTRTPPKRLLTPCPTYSPFFRPTDLILPNSPASLQDWGIRPVPPAWPAAATCSLDSHLRPIQPTSSYNLHPSTSGRVTPKLRLSFQRSSKVSPAAAVSPHPSSAAFARRCKQVSLPGCYGPPLPPVEPLHAWLPPPSPRSTIPRSSSDQKPPLPPGRDKLQQRPACGGRHRDAALDPSLLIAARQHATVVGGGEQRELLHAMGLDLRRPSRSLPSLAQRTPAMSDMPAVDLLQGSAALPEDMHVAQRTPAMSDMPTIDLRLIGQGAASLPAGLPEDMAVARRTPGVPDLHAAAGDLHQRRTSAPTIQAASGARRSSLALAQVCARTAGVANLALEPSSAATAGGGGGGGSERQHGHGRDRAQAHDRHLLLVFPPLSGRASSPGTSSNRSSNTSCASTEPRQRAAATAAAAAAVGGGKAGRAAATAPGKIPEDPDAGELTLVSRAPSIRGGGAGAAAPAAPGGCCSGWLQSLRSRGGEQRQKGSFSRLGQHRSAPELRVSEPADRAGTWSHQLSCFLCAWPSAPPQKRASYVAGAPSPAAGEQPAGEGSASAGAGGGQRPNTAPAAAASEPTPTPTPTPTSLS